MKKFFKLKIALRDEDGAVAPIIGLFIVIFMILLAFAVDLGRLYIVKNELQNTADAAALAGARKLYQTSQTIDVKRRKYCSPKLRLTKQIPRFGPTQCIGGNRQMGFCDTNFYPCA